MLLGPTQAGALCLYRGEFSAKTTIPEEFADSKWVVKAKVLSARDGKSREGDRWTVYRIEVLHAYKGRPDRRPRFFTDRNSGGFYMDRPNIGLPAGHDIGGQYLLFLNPTNASPADPVVARGSVVVNYPCGQSDSWTKIPEASRDQVGALEYTRLAHRPWHRRSEILP
jgi:hypothetical protein